MSSKLKIEKNGKRVKARLFSGAEELMRKNLLKGTHIEMLSNYELSVDGCFGVYEYTDCYIRLNIENGSLIINGSKLDIASFEERTIIIHGNISSVEFA